MTKQMRKDEKFRLTKLFVYQYGMALHFWIEEHGTTKGFKEKFGTQREYVNHQITALQNRCKKLAKTGLIVCEIGRILLLTTLINTWAQPTPLK